MRARLAADHRAVRRADVRRGPRGGGEHLRGRLRQARRHGARLLLGSGPRVPARLARRAPGDQRRRKPIDNQLFFVRLAQRIVHLLTMHSAAGRLYEVDVRLRPSGKGGLLVTNIGAFADYQRARGLDLGAPGAAARPQPSPARRELRARVRARAARGAVPPRAPREPCASEVRDMRERMRRELSDRRCRTHFDIKQDAGGVADIEFLAQYWALSVGAALPAGGSCSPTRSASSSRWPRRISSRRRASTCSPPPTAPTVRAATTCRSPGPAPSCRREEFRDLRAAVTRIWDLTMARCKPAGGCRYNRRVIRGPPGLPWSRPLSRSSAERAESVRGDVPRTCRCRCPMPQMYLWNSHPRVYLPIETTGWAKCPYCGAEYTLQR